MLIFAPPVFLRQPLALTHIIMIVALIDPFKDAHNLTDAEIAEQIGISESTISKHRRDPKMKVTRDTARLLTKYIAGQVEEAFPKMFQEHQIRIMRAMHTHGPMIPVESDRDIIARLTRFVWRTYFPKMEGFPLDLHDTPKGAR
jgi:hypothetical protein